MMIAPRRLASLFVVALLAACDTSDPTQAVVDDAYPAPSSDAGDAPQTVVYRAWWSVTLFADPVPAGGTSSANRVVPATDYAYALLAPLWDPTSSAPPTTLLPVRTKTKLGVARGDTLHIAISPATVDGDCASGAPLSQDDADFIVQRIFPGAFADVNAGRARYDAATCTVTKIADADADADADANADAGADAVANADGP